jgi:hypothetical protein
MRWRLVLDVAGGDTSRRRRLSAAKDAEYRGVDQVAWRLEFLVTNVLVLRRGILQQVFNHIAIATS